MDLDDLDRALLLALLERPRAGLREHARALGIARGTAQARFLRLQERGVIVGFAPHVNPEALGFDVHAFVTLHITQGRLDDVATGLEAVAEVVEVHSITGDGDLWARVVARTNAHLEQVVQGIIGTPGVERTRTEIALTERVAYRVLPLVRALPRGRRGAEAGHDV
jgi:DNA-binding Lrp family transcriptional regulator